MSIRDLEEEIIEIEKIKRHYKPGSIEWNSIDSIIIEKKKQLNRLQEGCDEENMLGICEGECSTCSGGR